MAGTYWKKQKKTKRSEKKILGKEGISMKARKKAKDLWKKNITILMTDYAYIIKYLYKFNIDGVT